MPTLTPKVILEGTGLTRKNDLAFALERDGMASTGGLWPREAVEREVV